MKVAAKIVSSILMLMALGFCVAFVLEEIGRRALGPAGPVLAGVESEVSESGTTSLVSVEALAEDLARSVRDEIGFADRVLGGGEVEGGLMLALALGDLGVSELESHFVELMARDLDDFRAVEYAGRALQEIASREPELAVGLLSAMSPAERERLVPSLARGWVLVDPEAAFSWIGSAWVMADGGYIDRRLQNSLYLNAMDELVVERRDYALAAETLSGLADPELREQLTELVARRIVRDGPENALDRLAGEQSGVFDVSVMDAIAEQWASRDGVGAAAWVLENEEEMSSAGVRSIAKHLAVSAEGEALLGFHEGLLTVAKRDSVAAEAARLKARREPVASADWARAIEGSEARRAAVFEALYEIGFEDFSSSVDYIDYVYDAADADRAPVVYSTLKDWLAVDLDAVAGYLGSGRAQLSADLSEELLVELERLAKG